MSFLSKVNLNSGLGFGGLYIPPRSSGPLFSSGATSSITGTTTKTTLKSFVLPGGIMGPNSSLMIMTLSSASSTNANAKTISIAFGATTYFSLSIASNLSNVHQLIISNRNASNSQVGTTSGTASGLGSSAGALVTSAEDTSNNVTIDFSGQLANAGDTVSFEGVAIMLIY